ncbi:pilus assembly protein N-terminal domain-containing protein [Brevundimonas sp.]|uniref:pilus assembly protein N-terminal domain-containing protein n=1 Tax=Brevundimonas sp. TaxID=1871086 RepID=UPI0025F1D471|nr:pilus assembly protein N-terminal domain-containing protein [Brevundimonas sp.]
MRRMIVALSLLGLAAASPALAQSRPLSVEIDHTARLNLRGAASSVVVGNPQIADVTVVDEHTLFISGRGFGVTEIVVLDGLGRTIYESEVVVSAPSSGQVRVWRGSSVTDMACSTTCAPSVRGGGSAGAATPPATTP